MRISVNIYSQLRYHLPAGEKFLKEKEWEIPEGSTIKCVVDKLKLPKQVLITVLLNNNSAAQTASLKEGDVLHILPMMGGG
jgi:sulfur carrier protein ThiS